MKDKELIILAVYINVEGLPAHKAQHEMDLMIIQYKKAFDTTDKDVKVFWFPSNEYKVVCIYPPPNIISNSVTDIENEMLNIYKLLLSSQPEEAKEMVRTIERKLKLHNLIKKT